jgi:peptidyl-prolyl cis-trans isomerase SurA
MYALQKGQITDAPVRTTFGYHVIRMLDREPTRLLKARHIMIRFQKANPDSADTAAARVRIEGALDSLKKGWDFAKLAMKVSEDPGSAPQGGELGWFERRRWVLPFDESVFKLHAGETSGIVRTPFGYHIIRCDSEKSLPPFTDPQFREEMKKLYQQHRYSDDFADYVARMKTEFHYTFNEDAFSSMLSRLDSTKLVGDSAWDETVPAGVRSLEMMNVNGRAISVDTILAALDARPEFRNTSLRRADLRPRIDRIAESLLLEAKAAGLEAKYPEFSSLMKEYDDGVVLYKAEQLEVWNKNTVSDSALKEYYEANKSKFMYPEKVNIAEIYADTDTLGAKLYDSLLHGSDFGALAARHAQDAELQEKKGERGPLPVDTDDLTKLGAKLKVGEFSEPTPLDDGGFVIVKLVSREPAAQKTFEQAAAEISNTFQDVQSKQLERQWIDRIKQRYPVIQYKDRLANAFKDAP